MNVHLQRPWQRYLLYSLVVILLLLVANVLLRGLANIIAREAIYELDNSASPTADGPVRQRIHERLLLARQLGGQNPDLAEDLGKFHAMQSVMRTADREQQHAEYQQALVYFTHAVQQRPVSPYAWANIVLLKYLLGQHDEKFRMAIRNATLLGVKTRDVQLIVGEVGLSTWSRLDEDTRQSVTAILRQALRHQQVDIIRIARYHGKIDVLCTLQESKQLSVCSRL